MFIIDLAFLMALVAEFLIFTKARKSDCCLITFYSTLALCFFLVSFKVEVSNHNGQDGSLSEKLTEGMYFPMNSRYLG